MRTRNLLARILLVLLLAALLAPAARLPAPALAAAAAEPYQKDKLHPQLREMVHSAPDDARFTVVIKGRHRPDLEPIKFRHAEVTAALKEAAARSQGPILNYLRARGATVSRQFWLTNAVVATVDKATLQGLTNLPEVRVVLDNFRVALPPVEPSDVTPAGEHLTWGLAKIEAERVWNELGITGEGIRVAVLDTGVDIGHPDIAGKMATDNPGDPTYPGGWIEFDANGNPVPGSEPHDTDRHGTHTSGTVLGGSAGGTHIGVAPDATLMHALILPYGSATFAQVVAGMQWAVEPTDSDGNPAGEPAHVVSMSFGATGYQSDVVEPIRNMYFAGIMPVASIGNCGNGCVGSPGAVYEAFGIGASAADDSIAEFSSGAVVPKSGWANPPAEWPDEWVKPDISAPGVDVISAVPGGGYASFSGTSMAAPHAAGTAALMLSANPSLTPEIVLETLAETSFFDPRYGEERPNTRYGWGRINAFEATARVAYDSGIRGVITDAATGEPLDQAVVTIAENGRSVKTKADGSYLMVLPPGTYTLQAERFGYEPASLGTVTVGEGQYAAADGALTPLPSGTIRGQVAYARTGYGIPGATVKVEGIPIDITVETDPGGAYAVTLPVGTYTLSYSAFGFTAAQQAGLTVSAEQETRHDVALDSLPRVAVIGDADGQLTRFLSEQGYLAIGEWWDVRHRLGDYHAVVINQPRTATEEEFTGLVDAAHEAGVGILFTKGWAYGWGIDMLSQFYGDPAYVDFSWYTVPLEGQVEAEHPDLLPGKAAGERFELLPCCPDVGWFEDYSGQTVLSFHAGSAALGDGVAYKQNANNRHVLLAAHGVSYWQGPNFWSDEAKQLFLNALRWAARPDDGGPLHVLYDLKATPDTVLWYEPVTVTVGVKNIGDAAGTADVVLTVNGEAEGAKQAALAPDQYETLSFAVQREPVGAYQLRTGHLTASFRVRPPRVTVSASTIAVPPSGRGRNADPGEPAIPLVGAQVEIVKGGKVISRGALDETGAATFDSTASRDSYTLVVRHTDYGYNQPRHYLLTMPVTVEDDTGFTFAPTAEGAALLEVSLESRDANHHGTLFLTNDRLGGVAFEFPTGTIVTDPGAAQAAYVMAYDVPGAQWAYASEWEMLSLEAGAAQTYRFGGDLALTMEDVRGQDVTDAAVPWGMADAYGHRINAIFQVTAGAFGPTHTRVIGDVATWPATVAATASTVQEPVLTLTDPAGAIVRTGTVGWAERPKPLELEVAEVLPGEYGLLLQAETGPYMGALEAQASLLLPARSLSRTLVMPGDTFEVTVVFDAGTSGEMALTESLPAGFRIIDQSAKPNAAFSGSTWTWQESGRSGYRPGQTVTVTYTVEVGADVAAGTYALSGTVSQGGSDRMVAGASQVQVVR